MSTIQRREGILYLCCDDGLFSYFGGGGNSHEIIIMDKILTIAMFVSVLLVSTCVTTGFIAAMLDVQSSKAREILLNIMKYSAIAGFLSCVISILLCAASGVVWAFSQH